MKLPFDLPKPDGFQSYPIWSGHNFIIDGKNFDVLEYSENFAGWSDDLTNLHEDAAGSSHPMDVASRVNAISRLRELGPSQNTVIMEIGCSSGFLLQDLVRLFPDSVVIGVDVVKEPLKKLAQLLPGVPLLRFDLLQCPLPNGCIDALIMLNVLEHIQDDVDALRRAFDLLKPGGKLIIEVPAGPYLYDDYDSQLQHYRRYSSRGLKEKLKIVGFSITRQSHLGMMLFPAFILVKIFNKIFRRKSALSMVKKSVSVTAGSLLVRLAMEFESKYLNGYSLPVGIRVLVVADKPTS